MELVNLYGSNNPHQIRNIAMTAGLTAALVGAVALGCAFRFGVGCGGLGTLGASLGGAIGFGSLAALTCLLFRKLEKEEEIVEVEEPSPVVDEEEARLRGWFQKVMICFVFENPNNKVELDCRSCALKEIRTLYNYAHADEPTKYAIQQLREDAWYAVAELFGYNGRCPYADSPRSKEQKEVFAVLKSASDLQTKLAEVESLLK